MFVVVGENLKHVSCRGAHKYARVRGSGDLPESTLQVIPYIINKVCVWGVWWPEEVFKLGRESLESFCSKPGGVWGVITSCWNCPSPAEWTMNMWHVRNISGVPRHAGYLVLSLYPQMSVPVQLYLIDTIGNKTRQIRHRVSSHQHSIAGVDGS